MHVNSAHCFRGCWGCACTSLFWCTSIVQLQHQALKWYSISPLYQSPKFTASYKPKNINRIAAYNVCESTVMRENKKDQCNFCHLVSRRGPQQQTHCEMVSPKILPVTTAILLQRYRHVSLMRLSFMWDGGNHTVCSQPNLNSPFFL